MQGVEDRICHMYGSWSVSRRDVTRSGTTAEWGIKEAGGTLTCRSLAGAGVAT